MASYISSKGILVWRHMTNMSKLPIQRKTLSTGQRCAEPLSGRGTEDRNRGRGNGRTCGSKKYFRIVESETDKVAIPNQQLNTMWGTAELKPITSRST